MNKLVVNQPEGTVEYCNSGIVTKLYQLLKAGVNESLSSLMGSIHVDHAYTDYINYIENHNVCKQDGVKKFHIAADSKYILFADPTVESMLFNR